MLLYESLPSFPRPEGRGEDRAPKGTGEGIESNSTMPLVCISHRHPSSIESSSVRSSHSSSPSPHQLFNTLQHSASHSSSCSGLHPSLLAEHVQINGLLLWFGFWVVFFPPSLKSLSFYSKAESCFKHTEQHMLFFHLPIKMLEAASLVLLYLSFHKC